MRKLNRLHPVLVALTTLTLVVTGCTALRSLRSGSGRFMLVQRTGYEELWGTAFAVATRGLSIREIDKATGVIRGESAVGFFTGGEVVHLGDNVAVFISGVPNVDSLQMVEVVSAKKSAVPWSGEGAKGKDFLCNLRAFYPESRSSTVEEEDWTLAVSEGELASSALLSWSEGDTVAMVRNGRVRFFHVKEVTRMTRGRSSKFLVGGMIGALGGLALGASLGSTSSSSSLWGEEGGSIAGAVIMAPIGFLLGGAVGAAVSTDEKYDVTSMDVEERRRTIRLIVAGKQE